MPSATSVVPFIDFEGFGDGTSDHAREIGLRFHAACRDVGFAYLINHGVPQEKIDGMFGWSKRFFDLAHEVKMTVPHPPQGDQHRSLPSSLFIQSKLKAEGVRGYSGIGVEQVSQMVFDDAQLADIRKKSPDFKESYDMDHEGSDSSQRCKNIWLDDKHLPGFKAYCLDFMAEGRALQDRAMKALALGMPGVPPDFFEEYHSEADNQLRLLHYPSAPWEVFESGEKGRIGAHTDFGSCTFLFQDSTGGLEVEDPHTLGKFVPAPPVPGAVIFNIGDFMMRWSNDELKSTLHRVRAPPRKPEDGSMTKERYSIPYFCTANVDRVIDALPGTWSEEKPKRYAPIAAGQYVNMRLNATYKK